MNLASIAVRNVWRNRFRVVLTILGVAIALLGFVMLRTVLNAWEVGAQYAAKDRIGTRNKVTFIMPLPKRYVETVREQRGIKEASFANWFGAKDARYKDEFFANLAVDSEHFLDVYDELSVPPDQVEAWKQDRQGALVGEVLARKLNYNIGDTVTLTGTIYRGTWTFHIRGIYKPTRKSFDASTFLFHWDYLNESLPPERQDRVGWIISRVDDASKAAGLAKVIDRKFEEQDTQTLSMSERAMNVSFMGMFSAMLKAINVISIIILLILLMILGNTVAMGVRERTNEYGVLRALGFAPGHIATFILGEAVTIGALAGLLGIAIAYPVVQLMLGRWLEENMGSWFPYFRIEPTTIVAAIVSSVVLGAVAAAIPARRAANLRITDALRRLD